MDQLEIEAIKNVMVWAELNGANGVFKRSFYVPFEPDVMIVRAISYYPSHTNDFSVAGPLMVWCDLVADYIGLLPITYDYTNSDALPVTPYTPNQRWIIRKPVQSDVTFNIQNQQSVASQYNDGTAVVSQVVTGLEGEVNICLEFVRYKSAKPQKLH